MKKIISIIITIITCLSLIACSSEKHNNKIKIVCTTFAQYDWTNEIIKGKEEIFDVILLMNENVDLHNYQPTVKDIAIIKESDLFIYIGGESDAWTKDIQPNNNNSINLVEIMGYELEEHTEEHENNEHNHEHDEHIWLSLKNAKKCIEIISENIIKLDAKNIDLYTQNTNNYLEKINTLDTQYEEMISNSSLKTILFADRFPFKNLANDYDLEYYAAFSGCSAETEASFDTLTKLANIIDAKNLNYVFVLENSSNDIANSIINITKNKNQKILIINSMQSKQTKSYLEIMKDNYEILYKSLENKIND